MVEAYPLQWPPGWKRSGHRERSRFQCSMNAQIYELHNELRMLGATKVIISTNQPIRRDGMPYAVNRLIEDPGVAVYFVLEGNDQCIPCDKWDLLQDNIRGVVKTIEALRGIERWGAKEMVDAAFRGFKALPHPDDVKPIISAPQYFTECIDEVNGREKYKELAKKFHPDQGGNPEEFAEMQRQWSIFKSKI